MPWPAPPPSEYQLAELAVELDVPSLVHAGRLAGGLGCTMDVLENPAGERLVLRRYGPWTAGRHPIPGEREAAALTAASAAGVPVPLPVHVLEPGLFADPGIVTTWLDGRPQLRPDAPEPWVDALADALVSIHAAPVDAHLLGPIDVPPPSGPPPDWLGDDPLHRALWVAACDLAATHPVIDATLVHGDFWPGNTLWHEGALAAVVDWEQPGFGDPLSDVAYCAVDLGYQGLAAAADRLVARYLDRTGRPAEGLALWTAVALLRPLPDIAQWVPAWEALGFPLPIDVARARHRAQVEALVG